MSNRPPILTVATRYSTRSEDIIAGVEIENGSRDPDHLPFRGGLSLQRYVGLNIVYLCAKFDDSSFSCSGDMVGAHQNLNGSRNLTTPLSETVYHSRATINLPVKFEVCNSTRNDDTKGDTKCRNWGGLGN